MMVQVRDEFLVTCRRIWLLFFWWGGLAGVGGGTWKEKSTFNLRQLRLVVVGDNCGKINLFTFLLFWRSGYFLRLAGWSGGGRWKWVLAALCLRLGRHLVFYDDHQDLVRFETESLSGLDVLRSSGQDDWRLQNGFDVVGVGSKGKQFETKKVRIELRVQTLGPRLLYSIEVKYWA